MIPQLLHGWIVNWRNQSGLTSHVEFLKASRPKVISPLALSLRTLMPSCIFCFQNVSTARWFPVISGSPFWTYSFLFLILQACSFDLLLLSSHFPMLLLHFPSFLEIKPLMLHESTWSFWILHYLWCQHAKDLNISTNSQVPFVSQPGKPHQQSLRATQWSGWHRASPQLSTVFKPLRVSSHFPMFA